MSGRLAGLLGAALLLPGAAGAGGFLAFDTAGSPVGWPTAAPVAYRTDQGGLGALSNADAVALVAATFGVWQEVPTATISYARAGALPEDVTAANFGPWLGPYGGATAPSGTNAVVFDADGGIFDVLFGVGTGVLGFAGPTFFSDGASTVPVGAPIPPGSRIVEGLAFLNGEFIDGVDQGSNRELPLAMFRAVFVHEAGHFSGLDHTQIHGLNHPVGSDLSGFTTPVETMYPFLVDARQESLERDDAVALSRLYPATGFAASTGCVAGRVLTGDGEPITGIDVIARNLADQADAVSWVSGADGVATGAFSICGLTPGSAYRIDVQEIDAFNAGGSSVGPLPVPIPMPGPPESWSGIDESADPVVDPAASFAAVTAAAGVTFDGLDVRLNRQGWAVANLPWLGSNSPVDLAFGDFDRDGRTDLVGVQQGFDPGNVLTFSRGLGDGGLAPPAIVDPFPGNFAVAAGQLDAGRDGFFDVAAASWTLGQVRVWHGDGSGGFAPPVTLLDLPAANLQTAFAMAHLDGDASPDLVLLVGEADGSATVHALLGSPTGTFTTVVTPLPAELGIGTGSVDELAVGRFAGGPGDDLVVGSSNPATGPRLVVLTGDGAGGFSGHLVPLGAVTRGIGGPLAAGDLDGDGTSDLALADPFPVGGGPNFTRSFVDLLLGDGQGGFTFSGRFQVPEPEQMALVIADLDGDGRADVAAGGAYIAPGSPGAKVTVAFGDGAGGVRGVETVWGLAEFPALTEGALGAADLDGDGLLDLVVSDAANGVFGFDAPPRVSVLRRVGATPRSFYTVTPCRVLDTRESAPLGSGVPLVAAVAGACGIPPTARAVSANVTVTRPNAAGHLTLWPAGPAPEVSTINFAADQTRANNAVLPLAGDGEAAPGTLRALAMVVGGGRVDLILDVNGYFE